MRVIKATNEFGILNTGPMMFNNDWAGVFLSLDYIKENFEKNIVISSIPENSKNNNFVLNTETMINQLLKDIFEKVKMYQDSKNKKSIVNTEILQMIETNDLDEDDESYQRVESGVVSINDQIGYFLRGDNSCYYGYILGNFNGNMEGDFFNELKNILISCDEENLRNK